MVEPSAGYPTKFASFFKLCALSFGDKVHTELHIAHVVVRLGSGQDVETRITRRATMGTQLGPPSVNIGRKRLAQGICGVHEVLNVAATKRRVATPHQLQRRWRGTTGKPWAAASFALPA